MYQFEVIERYHPFLAGKSYGILAKTCDGCIPQELVLIPNISHDRKWVARLAKTTLTCGILPKAVAASSRHSPFFGTAQIG